MMNGWSSQMNFQASSNVNLVFWREIRCVYVKCMSSTYTDFASVKKEKAIFCQWNCSSANISWTQFKFKSLSHGPEYLWLQLTHKLWLSPQCSSCGSIEGSFIGCRLHSVKILCRKTGGFFLMFLRWLGGDVAEVAKRIGYFLPYK